MKWAVEVTRLEDLPRIVRRAAKIATTPPTGPVFISLPGDILNAEAGIDLGSPTRVDARARRRTRALASARRHAARGERPVIVAGDEIVKSDALARRPTLRRDARRAGLSGAVALRRAFPVRAPGYMGALSRNQKQVRETARALRPADVLGADLLRMSVYSEVEPLPRRPAGRPRVASATGNWARTSRPRSRCRPT